MKDKKFQDIQFNNREFSIVELDQHLFDAEFELENSKLLENAIEEWSEFQESVFTDYLDT